jgi:tRNA-specific 2-thiouridylase
MKRRATVFVGLSGGVDSSVAAARLLDEGHRVVGVFIKAWHPEFLPCPWERERLDAMRVAARLSIPFLTCDAEAVYRDEVAAHFIRRYEAGLTPNPDVLCNQSVKFGAFWRFAREHGADFIATGHYARIKIVKGEPHLFRGLDRDKDQSYFLWTLSSQQLAAALFPLGESAKISVRKEAARRRLPTADKKDSQGLCFLGQIKIEDFLSRYMTLTPGRVLDEDGRAIGAHRGAIIYTIGQRHGFTVSNAAAKRGPHYIVAKDIAANTITVSTRPPLAKEGKRVTLAEYVLRSAGAPGQRLSAVMRYRQAPGWVRIYRKENNLLTLDIESEREAPTAGQSCVLYDGKRCVGGGIIMP